MQILVRIGFLYFVKKMKLFILIVSVLNIFLKKLKNILEIKRFLVQANNPVRCGYFCIGFIDFMLAGKKLTDYTDLFFPYGFNKNGSIILSHFQDE